MEEVCGSCSMLINGRARQACSALVDTLEQPIVLEPLTKFPVVRDLLVDRAAMFDALRQVKAWVPIDGSWDIHTGGPRISPQQWDLNYALSRCMTCGCCMEACPQFGPDRGLHRPGAAGPGAAVQQPPHRQYLRAERLHAIMGDGGITDCGNAQNCVRVCPKDDPADHRHRQTRPPDHGPVAAGPLRRLSPLFPLPRVRRVGGRAPVLGRLCLRCGRGR